MVLAILLVYVSAFIECALFKEFGNIGKLLIGTVKIETKVDGATERITFPEVSHI